MSFTILATGLSWYDKLVEKIPEGRLFSWRAVFDAIPDLLEHLPTTLGLTLAGAFFGLILALVFAIVKINRPKVLYPIQAVFTWNTDFGSVDADLLRYSTLFKIS